MDWFSDGFLVLIVRFSRLPWARFLRGCRRLASLRCVLDWWLLVSWNGFVTVVVDCVIVFMRAGVLGNGSEFVFLCCDHIGLLL